jgi:hypothetical protein
VSVSSTGIEANGASTGRAALSSDGRFVAFSSAATNLVTDDTNDVRDLFVRDVAAGTTTRMLGPASVQPDDESIPVAMSDDGRFVAFDSWASNLVPNDDNGPDVFVWDRSTGGISRLSNTPGGAAAGGSTLDMSTDGRFVLFWSFGAKIDGTTSLSNLYVADRTTGGVTRLTHAGETDPCGDASNALVSYEARLSGDGTKVVYIQKCVASTTTAAVLVRLDRTTGQRATLATAARQAVDEALHSLTIDGDGSVVAWVDVPNNGAPRQMMVWDGGAPPAPLTTDDAGTLDVSSDGRFVSYMASAYVSGRSTVDLRVVDRATNESVSVLKTVDGEPFDPGGPFQPGFPGHISSDGSTVAFATKVANLVANDTNEASDVFTTGVQAAFDRAHESSSTTTAP